MINQFLLNYYSTVLLAKVSYLVTYTVAVTTYS